MTKQIIKSNSEDRLKYMINLARNNSEGDFLNKVINEDLISVAYAFRLAYNISLTQDILSKYGF